MTGKCIKYGEVEEHSRRIGSALTRLGFKKGDTLNYITYESAQVYLMQIAVWRLGGAVRGSNQFSEAGKKINLINIVLID